MPTPHRSRTRGWTISRYSASRGLPAASSILLSSGYRVTNGRRGNSRRHPIASPRQVWRQIQWVNARAPRWHCGCERLHELSIHLTEATWRIVAYPPVFSNWREEIKRARMYVEQTCLKLRSRPKTLPPVRHLDRASKQKGIDARAPGSSQVDDQIDIGHDFPDCLSW